MSKGHNQRFAQLGELASGGYGGGLNSKQGHKDTLLGAIVLIGRVPDRPAGAQQFEHAAHVITFYGQRVNVMAFTATALNKVKQRVFMFAVHAVNGVLLPQQRGADLQRGEVKRHQNNAFAFKLRLFEVLQPFNMGQLGQSWLGPPPAHGHFKEGDTR